MLHLPQGEPVSLGICGSSQHFSLCPYPKPPPSQGLLPSTNLIPMQPLLSLPLAPLMVWLGLQAMPSEDSSHCLLSPLYLQEKPSPYFTTSRVLLFIHWARHAWVWRVEQSAMFAGPFSCAGPLGEIKSPPGSTLNATNQAQRGWVTRLFWDNADL